MTFTVDARFYGLHNFAALHLYVFAKTTVRFCVACQNRAKNAMHFGVSKQKNGGICVFCNAILSTSKRPGGGNPAKENKGGMNMKKKSSLKHTGAFWAFCAPCCILFGVFFLVPLVLSIAFSFTNYDGWKTIDFVGLTNYITLFKDSKFYLSLGRTLLYTICTLPFRVIIPLLVAVLLCSNRVAAKSLTRTMVYIPVLMSALVVGITINWMFSQEYGFVNFIIRSLGGTALEWSLNPRLATFVIAFASVWASIGFNMILYIGGINSISNDLYEAATIDGASGVQAFFRITVPMLAPTTFMVVLLSTVNLLKEYALVQGITQGGPGLSTTFIIQYIFDKGFNQMQYGYASAISTVVMIVFALIAFAQFKVNNGGET